MKKVLSIICIFVFCVCFLICIASADPTEIPTTESVNATVSKTDNATQTVPTDETVETEPVESETETPSTKRTTEPATKKTTTERQIYSEYSTYYENEKEYITTGATHEIDANAVAKPVVPAQKKNVRDRGEEVKAWMWLPIVLMALSIFGLVFVNTKAILDKRLKNKK